MTFHERILAERRTDVTRRWFFRECGVGLGDVYKRQVHSLVIVSSRLRRTRDTAV